MPSRLCATRCKKMRVRSDVGRHRAPIAEIVIVDLLRVRAESQAFAHCKDCRQSKFVRKEPILLKGNFKATASI
jgi:hypothetical protein